MATADDTISAQGFARIGYLHHQVELGAWWNPAARVELLVLRMGSATLLRGSKSYYVTSRSHDGETWARDIGPAFDYLEHHFPELHVSFRFWRDVPEFLAEREARRRETPTNGVGTSVADLAELQRRAQTAEASSKGIGRLRALDEGDSSLLAEHLRHRESSARAESERLKALTDRAEAARAFQSKLQREYRDKGSAAAIVITINSVLHSVALRESSSDLRDAVAATVKELGDADRFKVRQTFSGGRFKVGLAESDEPLLVWIEQWFGGSLNPNQLALLRDLNPATRESMAAQTMVLPSEDIVVDGSVINHGKLVGPRIIAALLDRVDLKSRSAVAPSQDGPRLRPGLLVDASGSTQGPFEILLAQSDHLMFSGKTRSGKSFGQRVFLEEVALRSSIGILVLDPRNQSAGLLAPQDRPEVLSRYEQFGIKGPQGFAFEYIAPGNPQAPSLPKHLGELAVGRHIVSLKGLDEDERCRVFADVLDAVFERCARSESASVRLVIAIDEAQLFTKQLVSDDAKPGAERAETALNRMLREGRKFGIVVALSSQSMRDFSRDSAAIRQNIGTKVFFHNSDREIEYARDYMDDPRELVRLPPGTALFCNPNWGVAKVAIRPPLSKVWDLSDTETASLLNVKTARTISGDAQRLLDGIRAFINQTGSPPNMTEAGEAARITSKRRLQQLLMELTAAGSVVTRKLPEQGNPRVIELIDGDSSASPARGGRGADTTGQEVQHVLPTDL